jgi:HPr kinase/phosphorylase
VNERSEKPEYIHASAVALGEWGVLIRGVSGTGKSTLALALVDAWTLHGGFASLVSDDRVAYAIVNGRVVLSAHPATAGLAEWRGLGLLSQPYECKTVLKLIIDLEIHPSDFGGPRLPEQSDLCCAFISLKSVPRLRLSARETDRSAAAIMAFLHKLSTK